MATLRISQQPGAGPNRHQIAVEAEIPAQAFVRSQWGGPPSLARERPPARSASCSRSAGRERARTFPSVPSPVSAQARGHQVADFA